MASIISTNVQSEFKIVSILDTDLYKFTMQQAIFRYHPTAEVVYRFTHRDTHRQFSRICIDKFREALNGFSDVQLTPDERAWLQDKCKFFTSISVTFLPSSNDPDMGSVNIEARGLWLETVLWEVPLMSCLCEMYFRYTEQDWDYMGQEEQATHKATSLLDARCTFSEFGTRRRRSFVTQDLVVRGLIKARDAHKWKEGFFGTSNVCLTFSEWFMGASSPLFMIHILLIKCILRSQALGDYSDAAGTALDLWSNLYGDDLSVTLTDTFSTEVFYREFDNRRANRWKALRQDSGDPTIFAPRAKQMYEERGIDHTQKAIIFSDGLDFKKAKELNEQCQLLGFKCSFGIGTWLTNDFKKKSSGYKEKSKALNIVIKLGSIDGKECVKISDEITKNTGVPNVVAKIKDIYQIPVS
ncbi:nicotinate phosphoribosyltransferase [Suillus occidentalis]|nr:nicotinate phosphoribosyltransferase [Suillus occidentalis]